MMKVEVLIYAYLAVCVAMIGFNIACIFMFRWKDKRLEIYSRRFVTIVRQTIESQTVTTEHCDYLFRALKKVNNLMAFEKTLDELSVQNPEKISGYLEQIFSVFTCLVVEYKKKEKMQSAYFWYFVKKYKIFQGRSTTAVIDTVLDLVRSPELYVRENALQAIYSMENEQCVLDALWILDESKYYHNPKLITDGLLNFTGDVSQLGELLWENFDRFSKSMQGALLDYFRFSSSKHQERILQLLTRKQLDDELAYSCIRYFGKYAYAPAYSALLNYAQNYQDERWEYAAIAASALANYPGDRTVAVLKDLLQNVNWHVRANASQSLMSLGLYYTDLIDVFEGDDRYASEIMRYRFDQKKIEEVKIVG